MKRLALLLLAACHEDPALLADVKAMLASREDRLTAYTFHASGTQGEYAFAFRAPRSTRIELATGALSFDGERFYERDESSHVFTTYVPQISATKLSLVWVQSFGGRVPEGFRAPLFPPQGVEVKRVKDTVELTLRTLDEGRDVAVTSVMRWPSGDFLERRTEYGGVHGVLRMDEEQCDAGLKLCVPTRLSKWKGETKLEETVLTEVRLNEAPARDEFVLVPPKGFTLARSTLVPNR